MTTRDTMELWEEAIKAQYEAALGLISGFDYAPRLAKALVPVATEERSPGIGTRPRFRSTTPGLITQSTARPSGVRLIERVEAVGGDDPIVVDAAVDATPSAAKNKPRERHYAANQPRPASSRLRYIHARKIGRPESSGRQSLACAARSTSKAD